MPDTYSNVINPNVPGLDTGLSAGQRVTTRGAAFLATASPGALIASLIDPYGGGSTFATVGTVPAQLALSGSNIVKGAGAAVVGAGYNIKVQATSADGQRDTSAILTFTAKSDAPPVVATPTPSPAPAPSAPTIAFANSAASVAEGDSGTKTVSNVINVTRNGITGPLTVNLSYSGAATSGTDYVAGPVSGTIADGQSTLTFDLTINGDTGVENDETIVINAVVDGYSSATASKAITVTNDDVVVTPTIAFTAPTATVAEGNTGTTTVANPFTIDRQGATGALTVNLTYGGNATNAIDYATAPVSVTVGAGVSSGSFDIVINGDTAAELDETIVITATLGSNTATRTITITNDDAAADPTTFLFSTLNESLIETADTPAMTSGNGPYWPHLRDMRNTGFPADFAIYYSTDHASGFGGIYLYVCRGEPTDKANWKSYDAALALGWFDAIATKPTANPIIGSDTTRNPAGFQQLETPRVRKIGSTWYMTLQSINVTGQLNSQATIMATSPDGIQWQLPASRSTVLLAATRNFGYSDHHTGYMQPGDNPFPALINPATGLAWKYVGYSLDGGTVKSKFGQWASDDYLTWVQISGLVIVRGRQADDVGLFAEWYIDVRSIRKIDDDRFVALVSFTNGGAGASARISSIYEVTLDKFGRELIGKPRLVLANLPGTPRAQGPELPNFMFLPSEGRFLAVWFSSDNNNRNHIGIGSGPIPTLDGTKYLPYLPDVNGSAVVKERYDFKTLTAFPSRIALNSFNTPVTTAAFTAANGLRLTLPAPASADPGTMAALVVTGGFVPNDYDFIEFYVEQDTFITASGRRHLLFGFGNSADGLRNNQTTMFGVSTALLDGTGGSASSAYTVTRSAGADAGASINYAGFGLLNGPAVVSYGVRWFPKLGKAYLLGEARGESYPIPLPSSLDLTQRMYPFMHYRAYDTSAGNVEQLAAIQVRTKLA